ncbi:MAG: polysaccharide deacetylase family protein [Phycisphaerae bacterium]|nr:polysaccharide deacetylase family protein [Phycisphaerae bacterium]
MTSPIDPGDRIAPAADDAESRLRVVIRSARNLPDAASAPLLADRLVAAGVTEAWVQCKQDDTDEFLGGEAFYPSAVAPVAPGFDDDRLAALIESLDRHGVRVCGWVPCFNDASAAEAHPEWRAQTVDPATNERHPQAAWLCPRHPDAIAYQASILAEVAGRYPRLEGIYTDFIRFDSDFSCACDRCLQAVSERLDAEVTPASLVTAAHERGEVWQAWTETRAEAICQAVDTFRDRIEDANAGLWFGACVLPFSAEDYSFNTQSGQDLYEMARVGLDEIVVMGYWDDWGKSYEWLDRCVRSATDLVQGECDLSCLLDGDMSVRRTWQTLDAVGHLDSGRIGFFHYGTWSDLELERILAARAGAETGRAPRSELTHVAIRIDTEPDYTGSYEAVSPAMIDRLVDLFDSLEVKATFVTCGRLAELQPAPLRRAVEHGHEIACHAYDHEQLDALSPDEQIAATERGLAALKAADLPVVGFGAPRNSVTPLVRDHLLAQGILWDGSAAYDPMVSSLDASVVTDPNDPSRSIVVIPFIVPNDWDALFLNKVTPQRMLALWNERLDRVIEAGEGVFVIDVHQWIASRPEEMSVIAEFLTGVKNRTNCRIVPLREMAMRVREQVGHVEGEARRALSRGRASVANGVPAPAQAVTTP